MGTISQDTFNVVETKEGDGWSALRILVQNYIIPDSLDDKKNIVCLSAEMINQAEFDDTIDELISQLEKLKSKARRKFQSF